MASPSHESIYEIDLDVLTSCGSCIVCFHHFWVQGCLLRLNLLPQRVIRPHRVCRGGRRPSSHHIVSSKSLLKLLVMHSNRVALDSLPQSYYFPSQTFSSFLALSTVLSTLRFDIPLSGTLKLPFLPPFLIGVRRASPARPQREKGDRCVHLLDQHG